MPDLGPLVEALGPLVGPLLGAFLRTTLGMFVLTSILAGVAYKIAAQSGSPMRSFLAVVLVFVLGAALGGILAVKRAVLQALRQGVSRLQLGQRTFGALFARILGLSGAKGVGMAGERGGAVAKIVEKLPLARAEQLLSEAVAGLYKEGGVSGFFRTRLHRAIVERVAAITLARLRAEGAQAGGVDLIKVRDELAEKSEELLCSVFDKAMLKLTAVFALVLAAFAILIGILLQRW